MLPPGSDFAGYRIERTLGRGGMADVYLARHPRLPRSYALKLMSEELSRNEVYRQRFNSEADIACMVQHESVVRVYDRGEDDDRLWLAMEYVKGPDLAHIIRSDGHLTPERSVALLERIAAGLDAIHALGLLHRDVKPANILVGNDVLGAERPLLTGFGIAKSAADSLGLTGVGDIVASLYYAAPEQFKLRSGEVDRRVDVYALGCVLYEMLTGKVPLEGNSVAAFWRVIQAQTPPLPSALVSDIPPRLDAVMEKALRKRRDDRFASAGELARAARAAIGDAPVSYFSPAVAHGSVLPAVLPKKASRRSRKFRLLVTAGVVIVSAAAVVTTLLLLGSHKEVPGVPGRVSAVAGRGTVTVGWTASSGKVDHYVIYRDGRPVAPAANGTSFTDKVADTNPHSYTVQAVNSKGTTSARSLVSVASADVRELSPAERALLAKLPSELVDPASCKPILAGVNPNSNLAITCGPKPGQTVAAPGKVPETVQAFATADLAKLQAALTLEISSHGAKGGSCSGVPQHGTWNFTETPKVANGQIICYRTTVSSLIWSYDKQLYYVKISTSSPYQSLLSYWQDASLHLP
jgi:serine/threonine protein kinase